MLCNKEKYQRLKSLLYATTKSKQKNQFGNHIEMESACILLTEIKSTGHASRELDLTMGIHCLRGQKPHKHLKI